jgi:hypothetical protein
VVAEDQFDRWGDRLGKEHLTWARATTMTASDIESRLIGRDLAVVLFRWKIVGTGQAGAQAFPRYEGNTLFVGTKRGGRWMILAGQVSNAAPVKWHRSFVTAQQPLRPTSGRGCQEVVQRRDPLAAERHGVSRNRTDKV